MNNLELSLKLLLDKKPFYAHFFLNSKIRYDDPRISTACVSATPSGVTMTFSNAFLSTLTPSEIGAVIEHETLHLLFDHLNNMKAKGYDHNLTNIAMDISINQYIEGLPKGSLILTEINEALKLNMLPNETWEYYYSQLLQSGKSTKGMKPLDEHEGNGEEAGQSPQGVSDLIKAAVKNAIDSAMKSCNGNVPAEVMKVYDSLRHVSKLPWQQILANFVSNAVSSSTQATRKKANRRFGLAHPGKKKKRELVLGVCVDSSGSISEDSYDKFMAEILRISKIAQKTHVVEADCVVQRIETVKKAKKVDLVRKGCGGTAYQPAITKCLQLGCDAIVYFGDFDSSDTPTNPGVPFMWVGVGSSPKPGAFGSEIRLND